MTTAGLLNFFASGPCFIGLAVCLVGGLGLGVFVVSCILDYIINRAVVRYYVYADFISLVRASAKKRRNKEFPPR